MDTKGLQQEFISWCKSKKKSPKSEDETKQLFVAFMKEKHPEEYKQAMENQKKQQQAQAQKAAHGAKLQYFRTLKNKCAEDEELYYYKKGGSVGCGCKKKEDGGEVVKANMGVVANFKEDQKKKQQQNQQQQKPKWTDIEDNELKKLSEKKNPTPQEKQRLQQLRNKFKNSSNTKDYEVEEGKKGMKVEKDCGGFPVVKKFKAKCGSKIKKHQYGNPIYLTQSNYQGGINLLKRGANKIWDLMNYNITNNPNIITGAPDILPGFSRNLVGLGKVVKTVNGVNYYRNSAGELKTAQEMAKEIKAAKEALRQSTGTTSPNVNQNSSVLKAPSRTPDKYTQSVRDEISFIEDGFKNGTLKWEDLDWKGQGLWNKFGNPNTRIPRYSSGELEQLKKYK